MAKKKKIIERAHCPICGADLCTGTGIYFQLVSPNQNNATVHLRPELGDYNVKLQKYDIIHPGTPLKVRCGRCQTPINDPSTPAHCVLKKVKLMNDPKEYDELRFLSKMGEHGTILKNKQGKIVGKWGEQVKLLLPPSRHGKIVTSIHSFFKNLLGV